MFTRKIKFKISFDAYANDRYMYHIYKTSDSEKEYTNKKEAYNKGGTLHDWSNNVAEFKAVKMASIDVVATLPDFHIQSTWKGVTEVYGSTYHAENIEYTVISSSEPTIPDSIIALYRKIKARIKQEYKKIFICESEIKEIRKTKELSNEQIKEIRKLITKWEKSQKIIREDELRIKQLEEQYPDIE